MVKLIRYAGYDPSEKDFTGFDFPELRTFPIGSLPRKDRINDEDALELREKGQGLKEIGIILARRCGRAMPYSYSTIVAACWRARKKRTNV